MYFKNIEVLRKYVRVFWKIPSEHKGDWNHVRKFRNYIISRKISEKYLVEVDNLKIE